MKWKTKSGEVVSADGVTNEHLLNAHRVLLRRKSETGSFCKDRYCASKAVDISDYVPCRACECVQELLQEMQDETTKRGLEPKPVLGVIA